MSPVASKTENDGINIKVSTAKVAPSGKVIYLDSRTGDEVRYVEPVEGVPVEEGSGQKSAEQRENVRQEKAKDECAGGRSADEDGAGASPSREGGRAHEFGTGAAPSGYWPNHGGGDQGGWARPTSDGGDSWLYEEDAYWRSEYARSPENCKGGPARRPGAP